nr:hypothetical protein Iba_chr06bCG7280 [Ipomoea batatas]
MLLMRAGFLATNCFHSSGLILPSPVMSASEIVCSKMFAQTGCLRSKSEKIIVQSRTVSLLQAEAAHQKAHIWNASEIIRTTPAGLQICNSKT